jgi:fatty-acyl-CoA synthase
MSEWTIGAVLDVIAEVVPDRTITVCGERRRTFAETADLTRRLANYLGNGKADYRWAKRQATEKAPMST